MISVTNFSLLGYALFVVCFMTDDVDAIDWAFYHFRPEYKVSARNCTLDVLWIGSSGWYLASIHTDGTPLTPFFSPVTS